ncbi:unnamed protein product [Heligmosomoides polygyrus]|uniref:Reverse transcriptase domain-containing protein n=1 Tax=Heligmosomoides polygyrus TaxID=6339 RepID=A0A183G456_HELPZ|nr:unnamed protein product [Heligmosomoides polygyrus]
MDEFWSLLDENTAQVPSKDAIVVAGDLNGHSVANERELSSCDFSRAVTDSHTTVDETWKKATDAARHAAQSEHSITQPGRRLVDKQVWLWPDDLKARVREKKSLYHVLLGEKAADNWRKINKKLESRDGEWYLCRLAKNRHRQTEDIEKFFGINNEDGELVTSSSFPAITAARLLIEKYREIQKPVHIAFLDLETAFDRVPREVIWYSLRHHEVPGKLIELDVKKTEHLTTDVTESSSIKVNDIEFPRTS